MSRPPFPKVLFGAGAQAANVINLMEWMGLPWQETVLFDDAFPQLQAGPRGLRVLGRLDEGVGYCLSHNSPAMIAMGSRTAAVRYGLYLRLRQTEVNLVNLIHPSCAISPAASFGSNVTVMPSCTIGPGVTVGSMCCLFSNVTLEHDTYLDENVVVGPGVVTSGYVRVGKHAFLGAGAVIGPEISIGERALIGAGAVVVSDIPDGVVAMGVPARVHGEVEPGFDVPTSAELEAVCL